jgi:hypothetical protein
MLSYRAKYRKGRIIPLENHFIPEDSDLIVTVLESQDKNSSQHQRDAFLRFMAEIDNTPPLPPEFDEILAKRVNIVREVDL